MNMIEQVARAMYSNYDWGCNHGMKDVMHNCAKLAIEAMREPSSIMLKGWSDAQTDRDTYFSHQCYEGLIDAALKEE